MTERPWPDDEWGRYARGVLATVLAPASRLAAVVDAYEAGIRLTSDGLHALARAVDIEPVRTIAATSADLTRDLGAVQVSAIRWLLEA